MYAAEAIGDWVLLTQILRIVLILFFIVTIGLICYYINKHGKQTNSTLNNINNQLNDLNQQLKTIDDVYTQMYELKDKLDSIKSSIDQNKENESNKK